MKKVKKITIVFLFAIIFTLLFHRQAPGINLLIFEFLFLYRLVVTKEFPVDKKYSRLLGFGLIWTSLFTIITNSCFSFNVNLLVLFIFTGVLIYPDAKSLATSLSLSITNLVNAVFRLWSSITGIDLNGRKTEFYILRARIFLIPAIIIIFFIIIYKESNPLFDNMVYRIVKEIKYIFNEFDFLIILTFLIGIFISGFLLLRTGDSQVIDADLHSDDQLTRNKKVKSGIFSMTALKEESHAGIFLLTILNLLLLLLNVMDIRFVWLNFRWEGQYLKQFVYEGTYLLILSILISIAIVLWFFRGNLNFYSGNRWLRYMSYIWITQNLVLALSVGIRNYWYIYYFALAYKRIGVIIFLVLTVYGLFSVFIKVYGKKSVFYLIRTNIVSLLVTLMISAAIDWSTVIARYNFNHAHRSFLHLDYLSTLPDHTLPHLDKSLPELHRIDAIQKYKFPFEQIYMTPENYHNIISERKIKFRKEWESKSFLSWNLPEYLAYRKLKRNMMTEGFPQD
ncbi:MAG: DUF4173 domain-containing protein [Bacteroidetes bacterium]|nr:DUF4173 domain-containing protein [Bacteroidota bacterium]